MAVQEGPAVSFHGFENSDCHVPSCAFPWDVADAVQGPQGSQSSGANLLGPAPGVWIGWFWGRL